MSLQIEPTVQNSDCHSQPENEPKNTKRNARWDISFIIEIEYLEKAKIVLSYAYKMFKLFLFLFVNYCKLVNIEQRDL